MSKKVIVVGGLEQKIFFIRGQRVMIDRDLAALYGVPTRRLNEQVKRNFQRFPGDFMFRLNKKELKLWMSQIATSNREKKGIRKMPYAFTDNGIAMLSSVLNSERAIQVNIVIMRTFSKFREILMTHKELSHKLAELEHKVGTHDEAIRDIFEAIRQLMAPPPDPPKNPIGFVVNRQ